MLVILKATQRLPTAHEQIEAKLQLRDWLAAAATPDVAAALLTSLDAQSPLV